MSRIIVVAGLLLVAALPAAGAEPVGVITELHVKSGRVDVKPAAGGDWQPSRPLQAVHAGDQLRAVGAARAVIVFMGSQGSTVVSQDNSPFVAAAPAQPGVGERVKSALSFLSTTPLERKRKDAAVRSAKGLSSVVLVTPRETLVAADGLALEWAGSTTQRYTARIVSADRRVLWERKNVVPGVLPVAAGDVRLVPGRYRWEIETAAQPAQSAPFEVAKEDTVSRAKAAGAAIDSGRYPPATAALLKASSLMTERFHTDARRVLLAAIGSHPDEPTLRLLLAELYDRTGLGTLADAEFDRAEALLAKR